jgi:prepilin-type N-terminal cleavage/methylation domain-containing protein
MKRVIGQQAGFTLIELLVVVAIIGVLSSIVLVGLNTARMKARDIKRLADFRQIALALELYHDSNHIYLNPPESTGWADIDACFQFYPDISSLLSQYLASSPADPLGWCHWYQARNGGSGYVMGFLTEQHSLAQKSPLGPELGGVFWGSRCRSSDPNNSWYCVGVNP